VPPWLKQLNDDPLPWLLSDDKPAVRHLALRWLLDPSPREPSVLAARRAAMSAQPIASILAAQQPDGHWEKPGPGYATKYRGTVWQLTFLDQLGAVDQAGRQRMLEERVRVQRQAWIDFEQQGAPSKWVTLRACRVLKLASGS